MTQNRVGSAWSSAIAGVVVMLLAVSPSVAADFPFEREMLMEVKPLPGSTRVPMLEIFSDGRATIDLWCKSGEGRFEVAGDAVKVTLGTLRAQQPCTPERQKLDDELGPALEQVTKWRIEDDALVLVGASELRYHLSAH